MILAISKLDTIYLLFNLVGVLLVLALLVLISIMVPDMIKEFSKLFKKKKRRNKKSGLPVNAESTKSKRNPGEVRPK